MSNIEVRTRVRYLDDTASVREGVVTRLYAEANYDRQNRFSPIAYAVVLIDEGWRASVVGSAPERHVRVERLTAIPDPMPAAPVGATTPKYAQGIPEGRVAFRATLTATSNPYLSDQLPLHGLVLIGERDIHGNCTRVQFMPDPKPGKYTSFVSVPDARFEFASRV